MAVCNYRYTARTAEGAVVRGAMQAVNVAAVIDLLRTRSLFVTAVDPSSDVSRQIVHAIVTRRIPRAAMLGFFRAFATLIRAGVSIGDALRVTIERCANERLAEALRSILADVEYGTAMSDALARRPSDFAPLHVAMIRAGETGGILDDVLERLAVYLERDATLRKKLQTALAYPTVVLIAASLLIVFMLAKIVPMFADIFRAFHIDLPPATQFLLSIADALQSPAVWSMIAAGGLAGAFGCVRLSRTAGGSLLLDRARLHLPVVGPLLRKTIGARVARTLGTLLGSGVELMSAIDAVAAVAGSATYARAFRNVNAELREGSSVTRSLTNAKLFDSLLLALVRVGEETGLLDEMLLNVAQHFESDVEATIATLGAVLEPALILILGTIVGFIVCSIFIPLYSLIGSVSK